MRDPERVTSVVRAVARTLGENVTVNELDDDRLGEPDIAVEVVKAADYHAILPLLFKATAASACPPRLRDHARANYLPLVARGLRLEHLLHTAATVLAAADLPYTVFKGPSLAWRYYPVPDDRIYTDVDLLVNRHHLDAADAALKGAGLSDITQPSLPGCAERQYHLDGYGSIDLHWNVIREPSVRNSFALDTATMLTRAKTTEIAGLNCPTLDDCDQLIAVATHACFDGAYRLGWLVDLALLLGSPSLDWELARRRCMETQTSLPVQILLDRTKRSLDCELPGPPLTRAAWRDLMAAVSAMRPAEATFRQAGRGGLLFRSTRRSTLGSLAQLAPTLALEGVLPLLRDPGHRWRRVRAQRD